tara:strand:+ start:272 stop:526 length:255 start_codon:yes stop_codon:yes gene_type:complete
MTNKETLKKQIIYRSIHRGSKEMDILLGSFVKKYVEEFNEVDLKDLHNLLLIEDEILYHWYFKKRNNGKILNSKVSKKLKKFKL